MEITKPLLQLWIGTSVFAGFASYLIGATHILRIAGRYLVDGGMGGGKGFTPGVPMLIALCLALVGAIAALIGLFGSWRFDKRALFCAPHLVTLLFCAPLILVFFLPPEGRNREPTVDQNYSLDRARN